MSSDGDQPVTRDFLDGWTDQMEGHAQSPPGMGESLINALTFNVLDTSRSNDYYEGAAAAKERQEDD